MKQLILMQAYKVKNSMLHRLAAKQYKEIIKWETLPTNKID
ncbi:hypothetical protein [Enterococcus cecorum]|nr:hypothetical protein [Enterococcus cecorum]